MKTLYTLVALVMLLGGCTSEKVSYHNTIVNVCNKATDNFDELIEKVFITKDFSGIDEKIETTIKNLQAQEKKNKGSKIF